jgi:hypothetical protein
MWVPVLYVVLENLESCLILFPDGDALCLSVAISHLIQAFCSYPDPPTWNGWILIRLGRSTFPKEFFSHLNRHTYCMDFFCSSKFWIRIHEDKNYPKSKGFSCDPPSGQSPEFQLWKRVPSWEHMVIYVMTNYLCFFLISNTISYLRFLAIAHSVQSFLP